MGWFSKSGSTFPWQDLNSLDQWKELWGDNSGKTILVFKHSTRCGVSRMAKQQFEKEMELRENMEIFLLDLLNHRAISQAIAEDTGVQHESPQVILFQKGQLIYNASHHQIDAKSLLNQLK